MLDKAPQGISQSILARMKKWGWLDFKGYSVQWYSHQRPNHDAQFQEPREPKAGKKKFVKKVRE